MAKETLMTQHAPRNVNRVHAAEIAAAGYNTQLAVWLTEHVGTMWTAYVFAVLAIIGLLGILQLLSPDRCLTRRMGFANIYSVGTLAHYYGGAECPGAKGRTSIG